MSHREVNVDNNLTEGWPWMQPAESGIAIEGFQFTCIGKGLIRIRIVRRLKRMSPQHIIRTERGIVISCSWGKIGNTHKLGPVKPFPSKNKQIVYLRGGPVASVHQNAVTDVGQHCELRWNKITTRI